MSNTAFAIPEACKGKPMRPTAGVISAVSVSAPDAQGQSYASYYYGMPAAHENRQMQGMEAVVAQSLYQDPTFNQIKKDTVCNIEILNVVQQALRDVFQGNKLMYVPADEIHETISEISKHVEEYKKVRDTNPTVNITFLKQKIGPGSMWAQRRKAHLSRHHPAHPMGFEPHMTANASLFGNPTERQHDGTVRESQHHFFGVPSANG